MGYTTEFSGEFRLDRRLTAKHARYLRAFANTRRMKRDAELAEGMADPARLAVSLPIGRDAAYFVGGRGQWGQDEDASVVASNKPPGDQPGLWCQWVPSKDNQAIVWNGQEKFYDYDKWLQYLIQHFLGPWGYVLNGEVAWCGEEYGDTGIIRVEDNQVHVIPDE